MLILGSQGVPAAAAAGLLLTVTGTIGGLCFAAWAGADHFWAATRPSRLRRAGVPAPREPGRDQRAPPDGGRPAGRVRPQRMSLDDWWAGGQRVRLTLGGEDRAVFVRRGGEGPAMTLLHGFPSSSYDWARVVPGTLRAVRAPASRLPRLRRVRQARGARLLPARAGRPRGGTVGRRGRDVDGGSGARLRRVRDPGAARAQGRGPARRGPRGGSPPERWPLSRHAPAPVDQLAVLDPERARGSSR